MAFRTEYQVLKLTVMKNAYASGFFVGALTEKEKVIVNQVIKPNRDRFLLFRLSQIKR